MRVRITAVDGYVQDVPRDDARFTWEPPVRQGYDGRVYADINTIDELVALVKDYESVKFSFRNVEIYRDDDPGMLEAMIKHDCYSA